MSEQLPNRSDDEGHPILAGLAALVGVGVVVGLILGLVVFAGTKLAGVGGGEDEGNASEEHSLYVPRPQRTTAASGPEITLVPQPKESKAGKPGGDTRSKSATPEKSITLSASTTNIGPMQPFNLVGSYVGGDGAILQVQRFQDGQWTDFNATGSVSGGQFQIPVQTSQSGENRFRVVDTDTGLKSAEAQVTVG